MSSEEQTKADENQQQEQGPVQEEQATDEATQGEAKDETPPEMFQSYRITCRTKNRPNQELIKQQSLEVPGDERARMCPDLEEGTIIGYYAEDAKTVHDIFTRGAKLAGDGPCLGWRPTPDAAYTWLTYKQVMEQAQWVGSGIIAKGGSAGQDHFVGIYANNRVEWSVVDKACAAYSMVSVPLYDTLGESAMVFIVKQSGLTQLFCDINKKAALLLNAQKKGDIESLKLVILMEPPSDQVKGLAEEVGVEVLTYDELKQIGQENLIEFVPPSHEDLYTVCYTSGTTGNPKGVMLTHRNMSANVGAACYIMARSYKPSTEDVLLSYLPLAHILERELELVIHAEGGRVGYFGGNIRKVTEDAIELKPTVFPLVPRMMNKIYDKVWASANSSFLKRAMMNFAVNRKLAQLKRGHVSNNTVWDKLVFSKVQALLGGRVRISLTGAAPISVEVLNFMRCALGVPLNEAYGATETAAGTSGTLPGDYEGGNVGGVLPTNLVKLADVEEKNYFAKDGKGEICVKGTNVFKGYYKDEENTKKALDEDGWYHTGDVGMWLPNGALKIIDRKKNIFKLSQGEYIAPEKIEQMCVLSSAISQCFVHGESLKSTLIAVVVADEEVLASWCKTKGFHDKLEFQELCKNERVNALILADMEHVGRSGGLKSFELPKRIIVTHEPFTVENDMLTPSLKNRRIQIYAAYEKELKELYEGLE